MEVGCSAFAAAVQGIRRYRRDYSIVLIRDGEDSIDLTRPYGWKMVSQIANSIASRSGLRLDLEPIWFNSIKD